MAYSTPTTAVSGNVLTAAIWNASVRDNFAETCVAAATTAGDLTYADGTNSMTRLGIGTAGSHLAATASAPVWRTPDSENVAAASTTTSTSFTDLAAGANPNVTVTTGTTALVIVGCHMENSTADARCMVGYDISGATTLAASDDRAFGTQSEDASDPNILHCAFWQSGLTAGSNTFTVKYRVTSGTGTFQNRRLAVIPF